MEIAGQKPPKPKGLVRPKGVIVPPVERVIKMTVYREHKPDGGEAHSQCVECYGFDKEHRPNCSSLRPFPIQQGGTIPWWLAEEAYEHYSKLFGTNQSLQRLAERGGFGVRELLMLLRREKL